MTDNPWGGPVSHGIAWTESPEWQSDYASDPGRYKTVWHQDHRNDPMTGWEQVGSVIGSMSADGQNWQNLFRRSDPPATPAPAPAPTPAPTPTPAPPPPIEATNPSLAEALSTQGRPALRDALDSALRLDSWRQAGSDPSSSTASGSTTDGAAARTEGQQGDAGRKFAASERWRRRLSDVSQRLEKPLG